MTKVLADVDLIIELLDARIPYSSQNPAIAALGTNKPCIKILSKSDLADPKATERWQTHFEKTSSTKTIATYLEQTDKVEKILQICEKLVPTKNTKGFSVLAMITGIPNVGKSTLINTIAGRKIAKTGDEPAITKGQQKIRLEQGLTLLDTPGILWPKIHNENSGYRLAATGAIKDTAMNAEEVAFFLSEYLLQHYPNALEQRYNMNSSAKTELEFLEYVGAQRGCLRAGGHVDLNKVSTILINEFRAGTLGRITLESPEMIEREEEIVALKLQEKAEREKQRKQKKHGSRVNNQR